MILIFVICLSISIIHAFKLCLHKLILIENIALTVNIRLHSTICFVDVAYFSMRHGFLRISAKYPKELSLVEIEDIEFEEEVEVVHKTFLKNITIKLAPDYAYLRFVYNS